MRKAIALIESDVEIQQLWTRGKNDVDRFKERNEFILAQQKKLQEEIRISKKKFHEDLAALAKTRGTIPPEIDKRKIHFHIEDGALIACDEEEGNGDLPKFLKKLFSGEIIDV